MGETIDEMKRHYQDNLKPDDYHKALVHFLKDLDEFFVTSLSALHKLVKSGRFSGKKLLEIGSGPTVHNIASASTYFTEIVQSDFVEANCEELRKWLRGESQLDWTPFLKAVTKIEGIDDSSAGLKEIEDRMRKSVKSVVHCDLLSDEVVPHEMTAEYDLIITSLTLEAVATDLECYVAILKRLNRLLRPGGGLVMIGFLNGEKWSTYRGEFHHILVSQEDVSKALDMAGFTEQDWTVVPKTNDTISYEYQSYYFVASTKI